MRILSGALAAMLLTVPGALAQTLVSERFEDLAFASRGWYDNLNQALSTVEHLPGSASSLELHFPVGAVVPAVGGGMRIQFAATPSVYLRYYVKYSANWTGSDRPYHPHEFNILTDVDGRWIGPAYTHLTLYVEHNEGEPLLAIQDSMNIDESNIGVDLTSVTEMRGVAGCNGDSDGYGPGDCYLSGANYRNGKQWRTGQILIGDNPGPYYKNDWHLVEALFVLNGIVAGRGVADGRVAYWFDGVPIFDHRDVVLRTASWPAMQFNQLLVGPYIGDGSPVAQTCWVDDLVIATDRLMPLRRDDRVRTLVPRPPLGPIFSGTGVSSLASPYLADFPSGGTDPDPVPIVTDAARPLVFYQIDAAIATLRLCRSGDTLAVHY